MTHQWEHFLEAVAKPARYLGREWNAINKEPENLAVKVALAFPDTYELGMSNLGQKILYEVVNRRPEAAAERVFAPWVDMQEQLRRRGLPLVSLESGLPLGDFDIVGFSLQYELNYTNVLAMLDLGRVPLLQADRGSEHPLVVAGGPAAFNPEPLAPFLDLVVLGEGEAVLPGLLDLVKDWKKEEKRHRRELLRQAAQIPGVYVPALYQVDYHDDGRVAATYPGVTGVPYPVVKQVVSDLDGAPFPVAPVVPYMNVTHDRAMLELFRGCTQGCRFCQAGMVYRPVRERRVATLVEQARQLIANTGYGELGLTSLSSTDYSRLGTLLDQLQPECSRWGVQVSLPSLRVDSASVQLASRTAGLRKGSMTLALEAATQRLRRVINKKIEVADWEGAVKRALDAGWDSFKLYFMLGLPTETDEDVEAIAHVARQVLQYRGDGGKRPKRLNLSLSPLVPKPHTPLQWMGQSVPEELERRARVVKKATRDRRVQVSWPQLEMSLWEAVLARGDRRLAPALVRAYRQGAVFDGWSECFAPGIWHQALAREGLDPGFYAQRERTPEEVFPWDHLSAGVDKGFLWQDYVRGLDGSQIPDCSVGACSSCGVCPGLALPVRRRGGEGYGPAETAGAPDQRG